MIKSLIANFGLSSTARLFDHVQGLIDIIEDEIGDDPGQIQKNEAIDAVIEILTTLKDK